MTSLSTYSSNAFTKQLKPAYNRNVYISILLPGFIFVFYPLLGCITSLVLTFCANEKRILHISFAYMFLFCVFVQSLKLKFPYTPGDWPNYIDYYNSAISLKFFLTVDTDYGYAVWNYIGHKIFGTHADAFLCFTIDLEILFLGLATYLIWLKSDTDARTGLCALTLIYFGAEIILSSNNILRQQFATSIFLLALALKITSRRKLWIFFFIWSLSTHSMILILSPLLFIHLKNKIPKNLLY